MHPASIADLLQPDGARARRLDRRMRQRLVDSLRHIAQRAGRHLDFTGLDTACDRLLRTAVDPLVFGAYYDLVFALEDGRLDDARACLAEVLAAAPVAGSARGIALGDPRSDAGAARYVRLLDTDPDMPFDVAPPPQAGAAGAQSRIGEALALLDALHPALAEELRSLVHVVVLAAPGPGMEECTFDGASSFMLWGAVMLNVEGQATALDMLQALVHESGHNLLFGLCADGPLVENDDAERYASPLRADPRPMDGIFHAMFVCARVHAALDVLLASGGLAGDVARQAAHDRESHLRSYRDGSRIVAGHGRLTGLGRAVHAACEARMAASS